MANIEKLLRSVLAGAKKDYTGLWQLVSAIRREGTAEENVKTETLRLVERMLESGFVAGFPTREGFDRFSNQDKRSVVAYIDAEWTRLGKEPNVWDIAWFDIS